MKNEALQFGKNATNGKWVITSPGEGSISLSDADVNAFMEYVEKDVTGEEKKESEDQ